jgi:hypothetical protein
MEWSNLRQRQINEKTARVVDRFEICVTMTWFGMVANGTASTFHVPRTSTTAGRIIEASCPPTLRNPSRQKSAWRKRNPQFEANV